MFLAMSLNGNYKASMITVQENTFMLIKDKRVKVVSGLHILQKSRIV